MGLDHRNHGNSYGRCCYLVARPRVSVCLRSYSFHLPFTILSHLSGPAGNMLIDFSPTLMNHPVPVSLAEIITPSWSTAQ